MSVAIAIFIKNFTILKMQKKMNKVNSLIGFKQPAKLKILKIRVDHDLFL